MCMGRVLPTLVAYLRRCSLGRVCLVVAFCTGTNTRASKAVNASLGARVSTLVDSRSCSSTARYKGFKALGSQRFCMQSEPKGSNAWRFWKSCTQRKTRRFYGFELQKPVHAGQRTTCRVLRFGVFLLGECLKQAKRKLQSSLKLARRECEESWKCV